MAEKKTAKFVKTCFEYKAFPELKDLKGKILPEIAVVGKSNVGKSSLLNDLFQVNGLVKTSSTPGKTQAINFFVWNEEISFVDLPGYGFAKVPLEVREKWGPMIQEYLNSRESLKLLLFLFDIRREPTQEDRMLMEWIAQANKGVILVLTKVDKVTLNEKNAMTKKILQAFDTENLHVIHYSVPKKVGREPLWKLIKEAME
ncbi:MAG: ribosome biogenesis GTP-binding protein YihA/YsxC [Parachlamydiaceae bacterium]